MHPNAGLLRAGTRHAVLGGKSFRNGSSGLEAMIKDSGCEWVGPTSRMSTPMTRRHVHIRPGWAAPKSQNRPVSLHRREDEGGAHAEQQHAVPAITRQPCCTATPELPRVDIESIE